METEKKEQIAVFRFGVIAELVTRKGLRRGEREKLIIELSEKEWEIPYTGRSSIGRSTIRDWLGAYERSGGKIESLFPKDREDAGRPRSIDTESEAGLLKLKEELKDVSLKVLLKEAGRRKLLPPDFSASRQSIYRMFKRHGLDGSVEEKKPEDRRRFEVEFPNELWQSDCMHGPRVVVDGKLRKTYLFSMIDDHSRLIPHAEFYLRENIDSYQDCLMKGLQRRGLPRKLYVDNGPSFRSQRLKYACASLGIALVYTTAYSPASKGKEERWYLTVRTEVIPLLPEQLSLEELNRRLWEWIEKDYQVRKHCSTGQSPLDRYVKHLSLIRPAPKNLRDHFRKPAYRNVDKDRTVSLNGKIYEAPVGLVGKRIQLLYHEDDPSRVEVMIAESSWGFLVPLDVNINSRVRRRSGRSTELVAQDEEGEGKGEGKQGEQDSRYRGGQLFGEQQQR